MRSKNSSRRKPQQLFVGRIGDHRVDAQLGQQLGLAVGPRQRRRRLGRTQQPHRMRIEREDQRRTAQLAGLFDHPLDDPRMAQVHAVEIADRHRARSAVRSAGSVTCRSSFTSRGEPT